VLREHASPDVTAMDPRTTANAERWTVRRRGRTGSDRGGWRMGSSVGQLNLLRDDKGFAMQALGIDTRDAAGARVEAERLCIEALAPWRIHGSGLHATMHLETSGVRRFSTLRRDKSPSRVCDPACARLSRASRHSPTGP
jgi:hypothetical protein